MSYPGGKAGSGVYQAIINQIPPHSIYVEPFLGDGGVLRRKTPADLTIGVEADHDVLQRWQGTEVPNMELYCCDGIEWLKHRFGLYLQASENAGGAAGSGGEVLDTMVYCDPPYPLVTRSGGRLYRYEFTDEQHIDLLRVVKRLPCMVAVSSYWSELYEAELAGWRTVTYQATNRAGAKTTEWLWCNYQNPVELHDYRYVGRDKREREKITRRVRNWTAGLDRMPSLERQAIVSAIARRWK